MEQQQNNVLEQIQSVATTGIGSSINALNEAMTRITNPEFVTGLNQAGKSGTERNI